MHSHRHPISPSDLTFSGGGIGGLFSAFAIGEQLPAVTIDLYEALQEFGEFGAGIAVYPRIWDVIKKLGLEDEVAKIISHSPATVDPGTPLFQLPIWPRC